MAIFHPKLILTEIQGRIWKTDKTTGKTPNQAVTLVKRGQTLILAKKPAKPCNKNKSLNNQQKLWGYCDGYYKYQTPEELKFLAQKTKEWNEAHPTHTLTMYNIFMKNCLIKQTDIRYFINVEFTGEHIWILPETPRWTLVKSYQLPSPVTWYYDFQADPWDPTPHLQIKITLLPFDKFEIKTLHEYDTQNIKIIYRGVYMFTYLAHTPYTNSPTFLLDQSKYTTPIIT